MKKLFSLLIVFISIKCFGQVYQVLPQYGYEIKRVNATLVLLLPSDTITNKTGVARIGTVLYIGNGTKWTASTVTDATKLNISDTASMLTPYAKTIVVNTKVNISDTASMLSPYAKTSAVNLKVNIADTAAMLTNYAKTSAVNSGLALKVNISDTASMLTNYAKTSVVNSGLALKVNISDTATMLTPYAKVILVNTKVNISDTAAMLANYAKTSAVNSAVALKVNIADTATMLTPYLRKIDTASLSNRINLKADINSPTFTGTVGGITQSMVGLGNVTNESKATMFTNATFTGTFATAAGAIGMASLANGAVANLSGTNTGDQTTITGNAGTATALQNARTIGTTTGDATSAGSTFDGTANNTNALTLATVNSNVGTFTNSTITVNGKGLITSASSGTGGGTVTSVAALTLGTTGTDLSSTVANSTTTPVITLQVPTASATNRGALSSADWTAFNNKGSVSSIATDNTTGITGGTITTTGTLAIDTVVLSTRKWRQKGIDSVQANLTTGLALKVNISDTSSMLSSYFRKVDTASLSNRINLKLNISDTSSMLSPYARTNSVNAGLALKVNISDTATMLTSYLRKVDTTAMLSPYKTFYPRTAISLTTTGSSGAATYNNSTGVINVPVYTDAYSGTVTSVATNNGSGITGGTITTSGTLAIDTLLISTRAWRQKGIDSVVALIPSTTGYVPYTGATQDVDLDAFKLNAQSLHVKGTAGNGHLGLKHQSASATASANEVSLFADNLGNLSWLNGNLYLSKFITSGNTAARSYTFPNATGTIALTSDLTGYLTSVTATSPLSSSGGTTPNITIAQATTSVNGYLSSADWTTFNGKESVLTFSSPLVRTTNTISIPVATTSVNGYLSSTDWTTFNNKQGTITLTTTGTSGAATLVGATLNIPQYTDAYTGTVTSVAALTIGTSGTDLSSSVANSTTTPVITLNVPTASATNRGALSSADWTTFNNKYNLPSLTSGSVLFSNGSTIAQDNANFFWDDTNNRLGIGTPTPNVILEVGGLVADVTKTVFRSSLAVAPTTYFNDITAIYSGASAQANKLQINYANGYTSGTGIVLQGDGNVGIGTTSPSSKLGVAGDITLQLSGAAIRDINNNALLSVQSSNELWLGGGGAGFSTIFYANAAEKMRLASSGNVLIGTTTDAGYKLDVNGTGRFAASYTASGTVAIETWQRSGGAVSADMTYNDANTSMNFGTSTSHTLNIKTNNTTALSLASTGAATFSSSVTATSLIKSGGTSSQFLMADGSVNTSVLPSGAYLPLTGGTLTGALGGTSATFSGAFSASGVFTTSAITGLTAITGNAGGSAFSQSQGLAVGWNYTAGGGEVAFSSNKGAGSVGGYKFYDWNGTTATLLLSMLPSGAATFTSSVTGDGLISSAGEGFAAFDIKSNRTTGNLGGISAIRGSESFPRSQVLFKVDGAITLSNGDGTINVTEKVQLTSGGNLLVGTTTDAGYKLEVNGTGRFSGNVDITVANTPQILLTHSNTSRTFLIAVDGTNAFFRANSTANILFQVAGGTTALTIASTQAATFSSSVTASQGNFNQIGNGFAVNMTNRNNNQTWGLVVDTDAVDDKILGLQSSYGITPFFALKLEASGGAATFSSSIKTAAPSGGTAKPFKIGAAATVTPTSQNRTIEIEIDGVTYYLTAKTTND